MKKKAFLLIAGVFNCVLLIAQHIPENAARKPTLIPKQPKSNTYTFTNTGKNGKAHKITPPTNSRSLQPGDPSALTFFSNYNTDQGLALNSVACGYRDKTGSLWFGTLGGGVSRYDGKSFVTFTTAQGLANNIVYSIAEDKGGNLSFGTSGGGVKHTY
jgi:ligand-binding sensor domain-containing protein